MRFNVMHSKRAAFASILLPLMLASCGGGGTTAPSSAVPLAPHAIATTSASPNAATVSFKIALPSKRTQSGLRTKSAKPLYVGATTQGVTIGIAYPGTAYPSITATQQCDANGQNCAFSATTSLPVAPDPYTFSVTAYGTGGPTDVLSRGTFSQTLVPGPNVVTAALGGVVASVSLSVSGGPPVTTGSNQVFPVTFTAFDADGNQITGATPYANAFGIAYQEIDPLGAFTLQPGSSGSATCNPSDEICSLTANTDTLEVTFNPLANGFAADPNYYPAELLIYDANATSLTSSNATDLSTAPCTTPQPLCVYAAPYYSTLLASGGGLFNFGVGFSPTFVAVNASTVWTDVGVIAAGPTATTYLPYAPNGTVASQFLGAVTYVPATGTALAPDYTGDASQASQQLDSFSANGTVAVTQYPTDSHTLNGLESGAGVIVGPDGNVWWIDPVTGVLRYANSASLANPASCVLQSNSQTFLTAAEIVPTPRGVTPSRIWFSAVDAINTKSYLGYVNVSPGSNSCGSGQAGHYTAYDLADAGTATPPNGLAVDGSGNAWYDEGDNITFNNTNIGEATIDPNSGTVTVDKSKPLTASLGSADQAWGIVYDPLDGNMYFATDNGLIGRFNPAIGISSATAYALPASLANLYDVTSGPTNDDAECAAAPGPCVPQFMWDPGTSASGRLTFVVPSNNNVPGSPFVTNVVVALDLSGPGVNFTSFAKSARSARHPRGLSVKALQWRRAHQRFWARGFARHL